MSQPAPKRRGRPKKPVASEEERVARELALHRERSKRHYQRQHQQAVEPKRAPTKLPGTTFIYHYQPHPPAIPSTTDPIVGLHLEPHLGIPTPSEPEQPLRIESTYNRDHDEPSELEAGQQAPLVWNPDENSRANHPDPADATEQPLLFEDSRAQFQLLSQGCDAAEAALLQGQTDPSQLETRDEELQELVDKAQQLLITPDGRIAADDQERERENSNTSPHAIDLVQSPSTPLSGPHDDLAGRRPRPATLTQNSHASRTSGASHASSQGQTPPQTRRESDQSDHHHRGQKNTLHTWLRTPTQTLEDSPGLTRTRTHHDRDGYLLPSATNAKTFTESHPVFVAYPRQSPRYFGVEWSYHGLYTWNLRRRLERQDYLVTEDVLCGIRLAIELSGRQDVMTLVQTIQLGTPNAIQLGQAEIDDMRQHDHRGPNKQSVINQY